MSNFSTFSNSYRYNLEKGSKKYICPECGKKRFVRYIDIETGECLPSQYGRCDRESNCGYHLNPYNDSYAKSIWKQEQGITESTQITERKKLFSPAQSKPKHQPVPIPLGVLDKTLKGYNQNTFIQNLLTNVPFPFKPGDIERVIELYYLGTIDRGYRQGGITFPFVDHGNQVRAIQVKQFDETNHTTGTDFLHSIIEKHHTRSNKPLPEWLKAYNKNELKVSCLFGAHLLKSFKTNPVALVEAPKSAVIGTLYFGFPRNPQNLLWLGVFNLTSLKLYKVKALEGRTVYLFPDLSKTGHAHNDWSQKAKEFEKEMPGTRVVVSDLLEQLAPQADKDKGQDLADYLLRMDWREFRKETPKPEQVKNLKSSPLADTFLPTSERQARELAPLEPNEQIPVETWDHDIKMLEQFFEGATLPDQPIKLNNWSTISDVPLFVESHLATAKQYNGIKTFEPYRERLQTLKQILTPKQ